MNKILLPLIGSFFLWSCSQQSEASYDVNDSQAKEEDGMNLFSYNWEYEDAVINELQTAEGITSTLEEKNKLAIEQSVSKSSSEIVSLHEDVLIKQYLPNKIQDLLDWADLYKDETQMLDLRLLAMDEIRPYIPGETVAEQESIISKLLDIQKYNITSLNITEFEAIDTDIYRGKILIKGYDQNRLIYFSMAGKVSEMGKEWDLKITEVGSSN